ncbi:GAP family protein [Nocardia takedensis]|uniref:GAP family protein n=1 Tax=Nocardia takedensis TaxID=259390 RepID=UPI0002E6D8A7|nr:GAP family protein [Nocardia takedensis]
MNGLFGRLLPELLGLLITPAAVVGCVLLLRSGNAVRNAFSFGGAFLLVYTQIALAGLLGGATDAHAGSQRAAHWVGLLVGLLFLVLAFRLASRPPAHEPGQPPRWVSELESAGPRRAFAAGLVLAVLNPNLFIMLSGISVIASAGAGPAASIAAILLLLLAAALDFLVPIGMYVLLGVRARTVLDDAKRWMIAHDRAVTIGVLLAFGALFTVRGLLALL